jgi:hypothetical protein
MKVTPKIDLETKPRITIEKQPTVTVELHPVLEAYCRYVFKTPPKQDFIVIDRRHIIGKAINGLVEKTNEKPKECRCTKSFANPVVFTVPETKLNQYSLTTNFVYMNAEENEAFSDRVEVEYSGWVSGLFKDGRAMNLDQLGIIEVALDLLNVRMNAVNFDYVKKYDYRMRKSEVRMRTKTILKQRLLVS